MATICKICGYPTRQFLDPQFNMYYDYCEHCEFIARDDCVLLDAFTEKKEYDQHQNSYENEGYVQMFRDFLDCAMVPFASGGKLALDFGSGPTPVLAEVLTREFDYQVDIYDLYYAPERVFEGKTYDVITVTEVIEHLLDPLAYFKLFKSLLKKNGVLCMMTLFHPQSDVAFNDWHYRRERTHISYFTPLTMQVVAEILGLELCFHDDYRCCTFRFPLED